MVLVRHVKRWATEGGLEGAVEAWTSAPTPGPVAAPKPRNISSQRLQDRASWRSRVIKNTLLYKCEP